MQRSERLPSGISRTRPDIAKSAPRSASAPPTFSTNSGFQTSSSSRKASSGLWAWRAPRLREWHTPDCGLRRYRRLAVRSLLNPPMTSRVPGSSASSTTSTSATGMVCASTLVMASRKRSERWWVGITTETVCKETSILEFRRDRRPRQQSVVYRAAERCSSFLSDGGTV